MAQCEVRWQLQKKRTEALIECGHVLHKAVCCGDVVCEFAVVADVLWDFETELERRRRIVTPFLHGFGGRRRIKGRVALHVVHTLRIELQKITRLTPEWEEVAYPFFV